MNEQQYEVFSEKRSSPALCQRGFYSDLMVVNFSSLNITMIDIHNKAYTVKPASAVASSSGFLELVYRSTDTPRVDPTQRYSTIENPIAATRIKINTEKLYLGPVYVEELEVILCLSDHAQYVTHPKSKSAYANALEQVSLEFANADIYPTLRIFANDPSRTITELYATMFGHVVRVPVTYLENRESTVVVNITSQKQLIFQKVYSMNEFKNRDSFITENNSPVICIGTNRTLVEQFTKKHTRDTNAIPEETLKIVKAEAEYAATEKSEKTVSDLMNRLSCTSMDLQSAQQQLKQQMFVNAETKNQLEICTSQINGYKAIFESNEQSNAMLRGRMQTDIIREKTKQTMIASQTERMKQSEVLWKLVGGVVVATLSAVVTSYLKDRK